MVKLGIEIKDNGKEINVKLTDPTKKQLEEATENEKFIAQKFKDVFDGDLLNLLKLYTEQEND